MTVSEILATLESKGDPKIKNWAWRNGAGENQFGVKLGEIRALAKQIKTNHPLALELWATGNADARQLAVLLMKPKELSTEQLDAMVREITYPQLADWLNSYVVKQHPEKESLREKWMSDPESQPRRSGWSLTTERVDKGVSDDEAAALLDRLDAEMADAPDAAQWTMNFCLASIGIKHPSLRDRAIQMGERIGAYRDYPVSKGCTSPFAPIWIREIVSRQG